MGKEKNKGAAHKVGEAVKNKHQEKKEEKEQRKKGNEETLSEMSGLSPGQLNTLSNKDKKRLGLK